VCMWNTWLGYARSLKSRFDVLERAISKFRFAQRSKAFSAWQEEASRLANIKALVRRAFVMLTRRCRLQAIRHWQQEASRGVRVTKLVEKAIERFKGDRLSIVFSTWRDHAYTEGRCKELLHNIATRFIQARSTQTTRDHLEQWRMVSQYMLHHNMSNLKGHMCFFSNSLRDGCNRWRRVTSLWISLHCRSVPCAIAHWHLQQLRLAINLWCSVQCNSARSTHSSEIIDAAMRTSRMRTGFNYWLSRSKSRTSQLAQVSSKRRSAYLLKLQVGFHLWIRWVWRATSEAVQAELQRTVLASQSSMQDLVMHNTALRKANAELEVVVRARRAQAGHQNEVLEVVQQEMNGLMVIARSIEDGQSRLGNKYISMAMELDQQQQTASTIQLTFSELASSASDVHF